MAIIVPRQPAAGKDLRRNPTGAYRSLPDREESWGRIPGKKRGACGRFSLKLPIAAATAVVVAVSAAVMVLVVILIVGFAFVWFDRGFWRSHSLMIVCDVFSGKIRVSRAFSQTGTFWRVP